MSEDLERFAVRLQDRDTPPVRVVWDPAALAGFSKPAADALPQPPWALDEVRPDWERWESLRVLSAAFEDGTLLGFASLRPLRAAGHDADFRAGVIVRDGTPLPISDTLISLSYDASGELSRVNLEINETEDSVPLRAAGERISGGAEGSLEVNVLTIRMSGVAGFATLDVLRPD